MAALPATRTSRQRQALLVATTMLVAAAALAIAGLRAGAVASGPVPDLARQGAEVRLAGVVTTDPVTRPGSFGPFVLVRVRATEVTGRGQTFAVRSPLLVIADETWATLHLGDTVHVAGRLGPADSPDLAAVLFGRADPVVAQRAGWLFRGVQTVRTGLTTAAAPLPAPQAALIPALVDGDDSQMPADVVADFKTTGLTHLLAVSGSNLTLVLGFVLFTARWCGVRGRGLAVVGVLSVAFFVLLARPEPSVLRAAAMGLVAIAGLSSGGRRRGARALCVAVITLVLLDPWLARSVGFLLSALATAGILLLAPTWRLAMSRWMPAVLAEAVAVPLAAQLVCTPVLAAISGRISLVSIVANMAAAPAVGPTTVVGLVAGLVAVVSGTLGQAIGHLAGLPAWWIIAVARSGARLEGASMGWSGGAFSLAALTGLCLALAYILPGLLARRYLALGAAVVLIVAVLHPPGRLGWPPEGWVLVMCDVGQGDGLVLNAGHGAAVVVDAGPDPALMDACLERLRIERVALVILTHFHADHVNGLPGVLHGRAVSEIEVSPMRDPAERARAVDGWAAEAHVPIRVAIPDERRSVGSLSWQVLGPRQVRTASSTSSEGDGSVPNNASIVLRVQASEHSYLLTGDAEPEEQGDLESAGAAGSPVDVLKVPHHGSARQDESYLRGSGARLALISVGAGNDYGHPSPEALGLLTSLGARVYRTDRDGDIAVVERGGRLAVITSKR